MSKGVENSDRLAACAAPHQFKREPRPRLSSPVLYRCSVCGGTATQGQIGFFLAGIRAGKALVERERSAPRDGAADTATPMAASSLP